MTTTTMTTTTLVIIYFANATVLMLFHAVCTDCVSYLLAYFHQFFNSFQIIFIDS